jgi:hypothetical protein
MPRRFPAEAVVFSALVLAMACAPVWAQGAPSAERQSAERQKPAPRDQEPESPEASFLRNVYLEFAPEFDTGKFGGKHPSSFLYLPTTLGYDHDGVVASVTVPYQIQRSHVAVTIIGGRPVRTGGAKSGKIKTVGGLGDVYLDAGYYVFEEHDGLPSLEVEGEIKFPTADDERGLGTGSYDQALKLYSGITFFKHLKLNATLGYGWIGQPEDIPDLVNEFHNIIYFGGAAGYAFSPANELWLRFDGNTRVTDHTQAYEVLAIEWDHYFRGDQKFFFSVGFGLTKSSPGVALMAGYQIFF